MLELPRCSHYPLSISLYVSYQPLFALLQSSFFHLAKNMTAKSSPGLHLLASVPERDWLNIFYDSQSKIQEKRFIDPAWVRYHFWANQMRPESQGHMSKWCLFGKHKINDRVGGVWRFQE